MNGRTLTAIALAGVIAMAFACGHAATHGFRALTSDKARQIELASSPRQVPSVQLVDSRNRLTDLRSAVREKPYTVVALVYTQCTTLCLLTTSGEAYLQAKLQDAGLEHRVGLLTISFDPARDTPEALARYAHRVRARSQLWTIATVSQPSELDGLLRAFGVVVIPDGDGGFVHNGALFLVDQEGRIFEALQPDAADEAMARLSALLAAQ
jgi:protein SCO1/2